MLPSSTPTIQTEQTLKVLNTFTHANLDVYMSFARGRDVSSIPVILSAQLYRTRQQIKKTKNSKKYVDFHQNNKLDRQQLVVLPSGFQNIKFKIYVK